MSDLVDNPYAAGAAGGSVPMGGSVADLPDGFGATEPNPEADGVFDALSRSFEDLFAHFGGYLLAALPLFLAILGIVFVFVGVLFVMVFGMIAVIGENDLAFVAFMLGFYALFLPAILVLQGLVLSIYRVMLAHERGADDALTFGFAASQLVTRWLVGDVVLVVLVGLVTFVGLLFFVLPGLLAGLVLANAMAVRVVEETSPVETIKRTLQHAFDGALGWHLGLGFLVGIVAAVAQYVPLIGALIALTLTAKAHLTAYRAKYGDPGLNVGSMANS